MEFFLLKPYEGGRRLKLVKREPEFSICRLSGAGDMPDFAAAPFPLISDRFKALLEQYLPSMDFEPCILEGKDAPDFWTLQPKEIDQEKALYHLDGSVRSVAYDGLLPIFAVQNYKKVSYVVNLALAESLLRRRYVNLDLVRIETMV